MRIFAGNKRLSCVYSLPLALGLGDLVSPKSPSHAPGGIVPAPSEWERYTGSPCEPA